MGPHPARVAHPGHALCRRRLGNGRALTEDVADARGSLLPPVSPPRPSVDLLRFHGGPGMRGTAQGRRSGLPTVLSREEVAAVLAATRGTAGLVAKLLYGAGSG